MELETDRERTSSVICHFSRSTCDRERGPRRGAAVDRDAVRVGPAGMSGRGQPVTPLPVAPPHEGRPQRDGHPLGRPLPAHHERDVRTPGRVHLHRFQHNQRPRAHGPERGNHPSRCR